ncbi:hypothetical protein DER46DRAFT_574667 [Fusarium sp. MPI-SDFR-AT-0072]|nr:hypothetical protein DER46DRAFT_574667 [Fusarium sp. MPI-SDFR-AT-0072]
MSGKVAPDRLVAMDYKLPLYLRRRTVDVLLYFAAQVLTEQGVYKDSDVPIPSLHAPDTTLIQIWQRARAQMLADGVPSELCLGGGLASVRQLLYVNDRRIFDPSY